MRFDIDHVGTGGTARLFIDGEAVGELRLEETFEFFVSFEGLDIGGDRLSPVRANGHGEFTFQGGLDQVTVELLSGIDQRPHEPTG